METYQEMAEKPSARTSVLLAALVIGVLAYLFGLLAQKVQWLGLVSCCLVPIAGGLLVVWHYASTYELTLKGGEGFKLGALASLLGYIFSGILALIFSLVGIGYNPFSSEQARQRAMEQLQQQDIPPEAYEQALQWVEKTTSPTAILLFTVLGLIVYALIGGVGGALGTNLFKYGREEDQSS